MKERYERFQQLKELDVANKELDVANQENLLQ
jgi:hypothetical protein